MKVLHNIIGQNSPHRRLARNLIVGFAIFATVSFALVALAAVALFGLVFQPLLALTGQLPNLLSGSAPQVSIPLPALEVLGIPAIPTDVNSAIDLLQQQYMGGGGGASGEVEEGNGVTDGAETGESGEVAGESVWEL